MNIYINILVKILLYKKLNLVLDLLEWLKKIKMEEYYPHFIEKDIFLDFLIKLNEDDIELILASINIDKVIHF